MIEYIENPIDSHKNLLNLINTFGKILGYEVNIQKLKALLYTNNEIPETETTEKNPIYYSNNKNEVPKNKFNQVGKRPIPGKLKNTEETN